MLQALLDSLPCGAAWLDHTLRIRYCNHTLEGWIGRPQRELLGASLADALGEDLARRLEPLSQQALLSETASTMAHLAAHSLTPTHALLRFRPHRDLDGVIRAVLLSAEKAERDPAGNRFQTQYGVEEVQRVAKIGTYVTDLKKGTWTASEGFCRIFGFEPGGVYTEEEFQAIVHPEDLERVMQVFVYCLTQKKPFDYEYRCVRRDTGEVIDVRSTSQIFWDDEGRPDHIVGIKQDITERKALERQLVASQRMEAIGQLTGGIAHDFNNILTAIMGFTELAILRLPENHPAALNLERVISSSERARVLIQKLLAFARRRIVAPTPLDLNMVVRDIDALLQRLLGENISLHTVPAQDLWTVRADPSAIEQVIVNLAVNARDAMPQGGTLTLETLNVVLEAPSAPGPGGAVGAGEYVVIAVTDNGEGMDEATTRRVFEPFFTTKAAAGGSGLGLATCHGLVAQAGGRITVYSEPGHGSSFKVYLPRGDGEATQRVPLEALPTAGGTECILVVEDDESVLAMVAGVLGQFGYQPLLACSGTEALQVLASAHRPVDLLLTDVVIPGTTVRDLVEAVRARSPDTRVIYMSGYTNNAVVHRGELEEGVVFLQKPFTRLDLGALIREVLDAPRQGA